MAVHVRNPSRQARTGGQSVEHIVMETSLWQDPGRSIKQSALPRRKPRRVEQYSSALPSSANDVQRKGRVLGPEESGLQWDSARIGNPVVSCFVGDNEQRWFMYYTGQSPDDGTELHPNLPFTGLTGVATSSDGLRWERPLLDQGESDVKDNSVLRKNTESWWAFDTEAMAVSDVQIMFSANVNSADGVYWMYYSGIGQEGRESATEGASVARPPLMRPGLAMSQVSSSTWGKIRQSEDGYHWARIEGGHYSGSLFGVGEEEEWDEQFVGRPQVLNCGKEDLRMYYHSYDVRDHKFKIGWAASTNGLSWTKKGLLFEGSDRYAFDACGAAAQCVAYDVDHDQFVMFYEAIAEDGRRSIGLSVSPDGLLDWIVYERPVIQVNSSPDAWDSGAVGTPWGLSMDRGKWRIYYSGTRSRAPEWQGIGVCLSDDDGPTFRGLKVGFRRKSLP